MKVKIHYTLSDGKEDSLVIEEDTIEQVQKTAQDEIKKRNATDPWSEILGVTK